MNLVQTNATLAPYSFVLMDYTTHFSAQGQLIGVYQMFTDEPHENYEDVLTTIVYQDALPSVGAEPALVTATPIPDGQGTVVIAVVVSQQP